MCDKDKKVAKSMTRELKCSQSAQCQLHGLNVGVADTNGAFGHLYQSNKMSLISITTETIFIRLVPSTYFDAQVTSTPIRQT